MIELRINLDCKNGEVVATAKHVETGVEASSDPGDHKMEMELQAVLRLAHKMGNLLQKRIIRQ